VGEHPVAGWVTGPVRTLVLFLVLTRGGLLMLAATLFVMFAAFEVPITLDAMAWYTSRAWPLVLAIAALAVYGFHVSLAGKPIFGRTLLED
jgi:hypothetical protein